MKTSISIILLFVFISCSPKFDFRSSNWGDSRAKVAKTYGDEFNTKLSPDMLSFNQQILGSNASINFLFNDNKLVSGFTKFDKLSADETKKVYDTMVKQFTERFGTEIFVGNQQELEKHIFEQKIWDNSTTLVSIRLDQGSLLLNYNDRVNMPIH
jgi:predicted PolB exonuclease-like 3'-5' exonuclease